ncbi:MAG: transposase [Flavisolibacter sp.]|nr:transposase [Flavisolibacter sp.]
MKRCCPKAPSAKLSTTWYLASRYNKIYEYLQNGRMEIDNNLIENAIRPVALGRKNYLFAGSHSGAQRAAVVYSLLGSCKFSAVCSVRNGTANCSSDLDQSSCQPGFSPLHG